MIYLLLLNLAFAGDTASHTVTVIYNPSPPEPSKFSIKLDDERIRDINLYALPKIQKYFNEYESLKNTSDYNGSYTTSYLATFKNDSLKLKSFEIYLKPEIIWFDENYSVSEYWVLKDNCFIVTQTVQSR